MGRGERGGREVHPTKPSGTEELPWWHNWPRLLLSGISLSVGATLFFLMNNLAVPGMLAILHSVGLGKSTSNILAFAVILAVVMITSYGVIFVIVYTSLVFVRVAQGCRHIWASGAGAIWRPSAWARAMAATASRPHREDQAATQPEPVKTVMIDWRAWQNWRLVFLYSALVIISAGAFMAAVFGAIIPLYGYLTAGSSAKPGVSVWFFSAIPVGIFLFGILASWKLLEIVLGGDPGALNKESGGRRSLPIALDAGYFILASSGTAVFGNAISMSFENGGSVGLEFALSVALIGWLPVRRLLRRIGRQTTMPPSGDAGASVAHGK